MGAVVLAVGCSGVVRGTSLSDRDGAVREVPPDQVPDAGSELEVPPGLDGSAADDGGAMAPDASMHGCLGVVCEDFEGTPVGAIPTGWRKSAFGPATIETASDLAHSGSQSLRIEMTGPTPEQYIENTAAFPAPKNTFYGRLWFRIDGGALTNAIHWNLVEAKGEDPSLLVRYGGGNPLSPPFTHFFLYNLWTSGGETGAADTEAPGIALGTWHCMEWKFSGSAGAEEATLWWNGAERPAAKWPSSPGATGGFHMPTFTTVKVGWAVYGPGFSTPFSVHIDDVAIGHQRLGCD